MLYNRLSYNSMIKNIINYRHFSLINIYQFRSINNMTKLTKPTRRCFCSKRKKKKKKDMMMLHRRINIIKSTSSFFATKSTLFLAAFFFIYRNSFSSLINNLLSFNYKVYIELSPWHDPLYYFMSHSIYYFLCITYCSFRFISFFLSLFFIYYILLIKYIKINDTDDLSQLPSLHPPVPPVEAL